MLMWRYVEGCKRTGRLLEEEGHPSTGSTEMSALSQHLKWQEVRDLL